MRAIVAAGEVDALVAERIWVEVARALGEQQPSRFFEVLRSCGALARLFPEIDVLYGVPQRRDFHPEIDTGKHVMAVLDCAARLTPDTRVRFASLVHDLGKGTTPAADWPQHPGHEQRSVALVEVLCARLSVPNDYRDLAMLAARYHSHCHRAGELRPGTLLDVLQGLDAFRRPERFEQFLLVCLADARGRAGQEEAPYPQQHHMRAAFAAARAVDAGALAAAGHSGAAMAEALRQQRIAAIDVLKGDGSR